MYLQISCFKKMAAFYFYFFSPSMWYKAPESVQMECNNFCAIFIGLYPASLTFIIGDVCVSTSHI